MKRTFVVMMVIFIIIIGSDIAFGHGQTSMANAMAKKDLNMVKGLAIFAFGAAFLMAALHIIFPPRGSKKND